MSDDQSARIGTLGAYRAFSDDAVALGPSVGGTRAFSLATIDVLEHTGRDLHLSSAKRGASGRTLRCRGLAGGSQSASGALQAWGGSCPPAARISRQ